MVWICFRTEEAEETLDGTIQNYGTEVTIDMNE